MKIPVFDNYQKYTLPLCIYYKGRYRFLKCVCVCVCGGGGGSFLGLEGTTGLWGCWWSYCASNWGIISFFLAEKKHPWICLYIIPILCVIKYIYNVMILVILVIIIIDGETVKLMQDEDLPLYLPARGDRLALFDFCKNREYNREKQIITFP